MNKQAQKLLDKINLLGIEYVIVTDGDLTMFGMGAEKSNAFSIGISGNPREGIKDAAIIEAKNGVIGETQEFDSQYVIDNFESIYNASPVSHETHCNQ